MESPMGTTRRRWRVYITFPVVLAALIVATAGRVGAALSRRPVDCDFVCKGGGCAYSDCADGASCPGGACSFNNCQGPSCQGGNCDFTSCHSPECRGGGCRFVDPQSTLRDGYCDGGSCKVNGTPFPSSFAGKLSI